MRKSPLIVAGCLTAVLIAGILATVAVVMVMVRYGASPEPFDDSVMAVVRPEISDGENAYALLHQASAAVYWDENENDAVESMVEGAPVSVDFTEKFLESNQNAVELVIKALDCEESVYQQYEAADKKSTKESGAEALIWALWHRTRRTAAQSEQIEYALSVVRLGHLIKAGRGPLSAFYRGQRFQDYGFKMILDVVADEASPVDSLGRSATAVASMQDDSPAIGDALRSEYAWSKVAVDEQVRSTTWSYLYDDDANKRAMLREYRTLMDSAEGFFCDVVIPPERGEGNALALFLRGNALGDIMSVMFVPLNENLFNALAYHRSYNSAVQVLLALKVYHMRNGELPETLDVLVPEFFAEVPKDWFDGSPIKYNRDKAIVYCVGKDLVDQGGSDPEMRWHQSEDPSWAIGFVSPGT